MSSINSIARDKLARLIGTPKCPVLIDVRSGEDFAVDQRLIPGSVRRHPLATSGLAAAFAGQTVVVICTDGQELSPGVAAWLRNAGAKADVLEGGFNAWASAMLPLVSTARLPAPDPQGRTVWVTRERPKIDRIACPWLIARFVDRDAEFLYVPTKQVRETAQARDAVPYDVPDVHFTHEGELCSFDAFIKTYRLTDPALAKLALIVRGADTDHLELAPQSAGLFAISLGLSRNFADDHEMLKARHRHLRRAFRGVLRSTAGLE